MEKKKKKENSSPTIFQLYDVGCVLIFHQSLALSSPLVHWNNVKMKTKAYFFFPPFGGLNLADK